MLVLHVIAIKSKNSLSVRVIVHFISLSLHFDSKNCTVHRTLIMYSCCILRYVQYLVGKVWIKNAQMHLFPNAQA